MLRKAPELFLTEACKNMNQAVCDYGREQRISAMGTTMAMIAFGKKEAYICNLGDSRDLSSFQEIFTDFQRSCVEKLQIWESTTDSVSGSGGDRDEAGTVCRIRTGTVLCSRSMLSEIEEIMKLEDSIRDIAHALLTRVLDKGARDNKSFSAVKSR